MQLIRDARQMILATILSLALAVLRAVACKLALSPEERRVLVERVEATLSAG